MCHTTETTHSNTRHNNKEEKLNFNVCIRCRSKRTAMYTSNIITNVFKLLILFNFIVDQNATHLTGTFRTNDFFKLLAKFGFQKTERHSQRDSYGYIYGNITSKDSFPVQITFSVLDKYNFLPYYGNRTLYNRDMACQRMFSTIDQFAFDKKCRPNKNSMDFLRRIPCEKGKVCSDEDQPANVLPGNQFTYVIGDLNQPRFWYISLIACYRNVTTCTWHYFDANKFRTSNDKSTNTSANGRASSTTTTHNNNDVEISYDIYLVNGNPNQSTSNPLTFHFSFDQQNILEMNLIFLVVYLILVPMQIYAVRIQKHPVTKLFTLSLILEFVSLVFMLSYYIRYAVSGIGNETFKTTGDILDILSRTTFMLILLLLAKGWAVTRQQITKSGWILLMSIWIPYCAFHVVLYVWNRTEVDVISDIDEYQTWPGWLVLVSRSSIMLWFLWELRNTMKYEHSTRKLDFLLHFGASSLVWFIYLPVVAIVASQVSPLWRYKLLLGITNSADCLGYCVMTGLLWPNRAGQYLLLASTKYSGMDELDEFNEAPHSLRSEANLHEAPADEMDRIDLDDDDDDEDDDDQNQIINILDRTIPGRIETNSLYRNDRLTSGNKKDINDLLIANNNSHHHHHHNNSSSNSNQFLLNANGDINFLRGGDAAGQQQQQQLHQTTKNSIRNSNSNSDKDSCVNVNKLMHQSIINESANNTNWSNVNNATNNSSSANDSDVLILANKINPKFTNNSSHQNA